MINKEKPIMVTGATGYMASWIAKFLLDEGFTVHATVRDKSNVAKYQHLLDVAKSATGKLEIFQADLTQEGSFDKAVENCEAVIHTASPFKISGIKDARKELIEPAVNGVKYVFDAASKSGTVKRIAMTSSIAAIMGDAIDMEQTENKIFTEQHWNTTSSAQHQPYPYSKTLAEKKAWELTAAQNQFDLVVINPGFILGPSLSKRKDSTSIDFMVGLGNGTYKMGVPSGYHGSVDVRDVAKAHILAIQKPQASGRHILTNETHSFFDYAQIIKKKYPQYPLPKMAIPKWLFMILGPNYGFTRKYVKRNIGVKIYFDNAYSKKDLGINYMDFEQTLHEHFQQLINDGLIIKR